MHHVASDHMHGSIFVFLKRFVEYKHNYHTWVNIIEKEGLRSRMPFQMNEVYPVSELFAIISAAAHIEKISEAEFQEKFGEFLVPDLLLVFKKFVNPAWRTQEMLLHIGSHMHGGIKQEDDRTNPPPLHVTKVGKSILIIDYHSKRRMAGFAIGIIKGLASYFNESEKVHVLPTTEPDAERVQIRVQFL